MAALRSLSASLLCVGLLLSVSAENRNITAEPGQDVTLTCRAPNNNNNPIIVVEWSRADLKPKYVLIYRDGHYGQHDQNPSFKNRVDLQDREMKDGDVSLILKNVTTEDRGTYECRVKQEGTDQERELKTISSILLEVVEPGKEGGGGGAVGWIIALIVLSLLLLAVGGFLIYKRKPAWLNRYQPPAELAAVGPEEGGEKEGGEKEGGEEEGGEKEGGEKKGGEKEGGEKKGGGEKHVLLD